MIDWNRGPNVVCRRQDAVAVYRTQFDDVAIVREADWNEDEDIAIIIQHGNVIAVCYAILAAAGLNTVQLIHDYGGGCEDIPRPPRAEIVGIASDRTDIDWDKAGAAFDANTPRAKDPTGAKRQRRYRDRHRNGSRNGVTGPEPLFAPDELPMAAE